jgi:dihydrofolate reductase
MAEDATEIMVVGGANLYAQALPIAGRVYLTLVDAEFEGDTHFPDVDPADWTETERERHPADEKNRWPYVFTTLVRTPRPGLVA